jgi:gliding motility-associated-like protein
MKNLYFRYLAALFIICFFCFSAKKSAAQLTPGDFAIIGFNGNAPTVNLGIVALKVIPSGTVLKITDQGWDQSALVTNGSDGLITWTTTSSIPAGTIFNIAITGGASPTATGLAAYGTATAAGWSTGTVVAGGGDNWFLYSGSDASPNFIYGFANWSTALPGTNAPDPVTGWQAAGTVTAAVSYLPTTLAAGNFYVTLTIAGTPPTGYHGDFNNYSGTFTGTKASILAAINTKSNWTTTELLANKKSLDPGGAAFPGTNPIFQLGTNVSGVTSSTANGTYKTGDVIAVNVTFSTIVNVTGTPLLSLNTGANASYSGGTGTNTLTFDYTVGSGQSTADLDYASTTALSLNGGTIKDAGSTDATLTLAAPGAANSLGNNKAIVIDGISPTVTSVNSTTPNGSYKAGDVVIINLNFSEAVTVTGTPQLALNPGLVINYTSGSGTSTLNFNYTVGAGQNSADLDYINTGSVTVSGAAIKDAAGNSAILTLPAPGAANSLGANKNIIIDTTSPLVSSVNSSLPNGTYKIGDLIPVTVNFSEAVTVTGTPTLSLNSGGTASYASGTGTTALIFNYTVALNQAIADLDQASTTALALAGGTIKDAAGNDATLTLATPGAAGSLGANKNIVINTTVPTVLSITRTGNATINGTSAQFLVTFSENVTGVNTSDFSITSTGITGPAVTFVSGSNDTRTVTVNTGTGSGTLRLDLKSSGTGIINTIGNDIQAGYTAGEVYTIDKAIPTLTAVTIASNNANIAKAKTGDVVTLNFTASETIGTPVVSILGNTATVTNTAANDWTATYTTQAGDADGVIPFNIAFADVAGNVGTAITATTNASSVTFDKTAPTLTAATIVSNNASNQIAKTGDIITLSFTASEAVALPVVTIAGNPVVPTSAGGNSFTAAYTLTGTETEGAVAFNIAFTDLTGNAGTAVTATTNSSSVTYDKTIPNLSTVTIASNNLSPSLAKAGDLITLNFTASEAIVIPTVTIAGTAVTPTNSGGNNWVATQIVSGLTPEGVLAFNIAFSDFPGNAGTPVTATTNSSTVTVDRTAPAAPTGLAAIAGNTQNTITWNASPAPDLDKYILYAGTTINPTTAIQTIAAGTLTYTHTGLTNGIDYFYQISAVDITGNEGAKSSNIVSAPKGTQTITFNPLATSVYGAGPITLTATSSSALAVTYTSSNTAVATVSGSTITVLTAGTTTITASQAGNSAFLAATPITQDLVVNKKDIAVTATVTTKEYGAADPTFAYTFSPALIGTDTFTGNLDRATGENVGNYAIGQGTLALSNNYTLNFTSADLNITAKPVTVTAAAKTKIFTAADPVFTYTFSPALIGTDTFTGNLDRAPGEDVGTYAIGQGNLSLGTNYQITYVPADLTITSQAITVTATAQTKIYGDADPALTYTFSPALNGTDTFTGNLDRAAGENIGNYAIGQGTLALSNNYTLNYTTADLSITKKTIAVTATAGNKEYGTADPVFAYAFSPALIGTDTFTGTLDRATGENIGNYAIGQGTLALNSNYTLAFTSADFSITKKTVNVIAVADTKVYGTADPVFTYTFSPALIGTDTFTGTLDRATGENVGNYAIGQGTLALNNNYTLAFTSADLNITAKPVTVTAAAKTKIFTAADPAFTYTFSPALIGTDTFTGNLDRAPGENIGNYAIGQGNLSLGTNYQITYVPADLTITSQAITVTATAQTKVYGDADPALTYTFSPALNGTDTFTGNLDRAAGENIGNYAITQGTLALSNNYTLNYATADLSITKKTIAVTATAGNKEYGTADPVFAYTFSPSLIGTDTFTGNLDRATGENIGNYAIGQGTLALSNNYTLSYTAADFSITKKTVNVIAVADTKVYGTADPVFTYTFSPVLIGTDTFTGTLDRATGENVGNHAINQGTLALSSNYTLAFTSADLNITAKPVTVTAAAKTKIFTAADPAFTYTFSPALIGTDTFTGNLDRAPGEDVGTYAIGQGNLSLGTNYQITYIPANLSITSQAITVTATAQTKVYGDTDPALTYTFSPALNGTDTFTGNLDRVAGENVGNYAITQGTLALSNNYTLNYTAADLSIIKKTIAVTATAGNKEYGTADPVFAYTFSPALTGTDAFTGSLDRAVGENIGNYAIGQGTLALNANYTLAFTSADFSITKKTVNVIAVADTKVYGTADPAFTYTFSPALIGTDAFTGTLDRAAGENIGNYAIGQGTLALNNNYTLAFTSADLNITAKPVTVTAVAKTKIFTAADPAFTYTFSPALIGTDTFTGNLDRAPGEDVGTYAIGQGNLSLGTNYQITYVPANLTITSQAITVTATAQTKVYGDADPTLTYTFSPALNGTDTFTGNLDRATGENIGNYAIGQGTLALNNNYVLTFTSADLSITKKTVNVTATAGSKEYGTADPVFAYTFSPALIGSDTFTGNLDRAAGENIGNYAIGQGTLALNSNYILNYATADFSITKKTVNVTATVKTKIYGEADPALTYTFSPALIGTDTFTGNLDRATGENIGNYAIGQGTLALNSNYILNYATADFSITKKTINVTATVKTKIYGEADPALTYTFSPALIGTDTFTGNLDRATGEDIGNYAIGQGNLSLGTNYQITYVPANLSITSKSITVTAVAKTKVYGEADPALTYTFSPALNGTDVFTGNLDRAAGENIGNYAIGQGNLSLGTNYTLVYNGANLTITQKAIAVTASTGNKEYGTADPALTYTFSPVLIGTDTFTGNLDRATGENIGNYAIGQGTLALNSNYILNYATADFSITKKTVNVTATVKTKEYGTTDPALTYTFSPALIGTDVFTGSLNRTAGENIGNYAIGQGTLALNSNYTLNYATADFSITKKTVNVMATVKTKVYGEADPALTYTFSPTLIGTDVFTGSLNRAAGENIGNYAIGQGTLALNSNYTLAFTSADLNITEKPITVTAVAKTKVYGTVDPALTYTFSQALIGTDAFTGNLNRAPGENIGSYAITQGTLTAGPNYLITYNPANLSITTKALTVTAVAQSKTYGEADPVLTYTFSPALTGTDTFTGSLTRAAGENIGSYAIAQGTVTAGPNYLITYTPANLSIGTKTITATATPAAKTYGTADPALTYTFSPALIGTDAFTGSLNRVPGENTGTYAINQNTLALNTNYVLNYTAANLSINQAPLIITAEDKVKFAGTANPAFTVKYDGFVNAETPAVLTSPVVISTTATTNSPIGTYDIVPSAATAGNYQISFVNGTLTIRAGAPTNVLLAGATVYENSPSGTPAGTISSTADDPAATFTYTLVSGTGDTDNALFSISGNNLLTAASLNFENKSSYSIRVKSTTQYGFSLEKAFNISISDVNEIPTLDPVASQTICYTTSAQNVALTGITAGPESAQTTTVTATSSNNNLFQNITATNTGNSGNISYRVKSGASGTATITVTVKDDGGTDNGGVDTYSRTFVITVNPLPIIAITADNGNNNSATGIEISKGESLKLTATGGVSYVWATHSSIISGQNTATLTVRPRETTTYTVTATNGSGCTDSKTFTVTVVEDYAKVKATNILSPNGDGYNDKWVIDNIDFYPNNEVKIFDKAGRPIYSKKGYDNSWDGNLNGTALSEGTYYYVIDFGTSRPKFKGFITVIRQN